MNLGVYLFSQSNFNPEKKFSDLIKRAKYYESIGIDTLWIADGLISSKIDPTRYPHYETLSLISALS